MITCAHCLRYEAYDFSEKEIVIEKFDGTSLCKIAKIKKIDHILDYAILEIDDEFGLLTSYVLQLNISENQAKNNDESYLCGFPDHALGREIDITPCSVKNTSLGTAKKFDFEIDKLIRKGNSGGPIMNKYFEVTGIAKEGATQAHGSDIALHINKVTI